MDAFAAALGAHDGFDSDRPVQGQPEHSKQHRQFQGQLTRSTRKALRTSRPGQVLASIQGSARELYLVAPPGKTDLSYTSPRRTTPCRLRQTTSHALASRSDPARHPEPASLYSILARYLQHHTEPLETKSSFRYTKAEVHLLRSHGYTPDSVEKWASCLVDSKSNSGAKIFEPGREMPPLFLLLLYLRRKHVRMFALGIIMRHIEHRTKIEPISWAALTILIIRLLRHARQVWPESIPWIATFFTTEATRLHNDDGSKPLSSNMLSHVTQFCNNFLLLLSLPGNSHPILSSAYQEKAQFQVLQYMASYSPAILVTKLGFRSVARNQLAHAKTEKEREWAELKGPSWPPWKENRTAMDEDKGYEFGASRASRILQRMYEAGYSGRIWEEMAEIYAGWDTDYSPTIQTRTSLPRFSTQYRDEKHLRSLLWAGRIRTTRTRREAWACFLAHEATGAPAHEEMYLAMFEKLYYPIAERSPHRKSKLELDEEFEQPTADMLPGDMKEVLPDQTSSLHHVFLSEPVPTYKQLYHRMNTKPIRPSNRLLAFLLETCPDFKMALEILSTTTSDSTSGMARLLAGVHDDDGSIRSMPGYIFTAFIRLLCRFGHFDKAPSGNGRNFASPENHAYLFETNKQYLLEYAYALLINYRPKYRPAWTAYINKLVQQKGSELAGNAARHQIICDLIEHMEQVDLDIDDEIFRLICTATLYAVQSANQGSASIENTRHVLLNSSSRLRTLFHGLVGANADMQLPISAQTMNVVPSHIPGPAELHAYVRALGILHDYEGLYSFSTWLTKHHVEVTARAEARQSGSKLLFRTLVALRVAVDGRMDSGQEQDLEGSAEIAQLIKAQIESVEEWGGWPEQEYVDMYIKGHLKTAMPGVGGR